MVPCLRLLLPLSQSTPTWALVSTIVSSLAFIWDCLKSDINDSNSHLLWVELPELAVNTFACILLWLLLPPVICVCLILLLSACLNSHNSTTVVFVAASHQTRLDTRSKARRPIKVGIKGRGRSGRSRDSNPACQCCSSAHLVQCEPDEASSFTNPNVGPGAYASLRLKLDAWSSAVQRGQKCSSPTRRLPSRSWGPIRPRVCSWFRAPIRHECQTAQLKSRGARPHNSTTVFVSVSTSSLSILSDCVF